MTNAAEGLKPQQDDNIFHPEGLFMGALQPSSPLIAQDFDDINFDLPDTQDLALHSAAPVVQPSSPLSTVQDTSVVFTPSTQQYGESYGQDSYDSQPMDNTSIASDTMGIHLDYRASQIIPTSSQLTNSHSSAISPSPNQQYGSQDNHDYSWTRGGSAQSDHVLSSPFTPNSTLQHVGIAGASTHNQYTSTVPAYLQGPSLSSLNLNTALAAPSTSVHSFGQTGRMLQVPGYGHAQGYHRYSPTAVLPDGTGLQVNHFASARPNHSPVVGQTMYRQSGNLIDFPIQPPPHHASRPQLQNNASLHTRAPGRLTGSHILAPVSDKGPDGKWICRSCGETLADRKGARRHHHDKHVNDKIFHCSYCDHRCNRRDNLRRHLRQMHNFTLPSTRQQTTQHTSLN